ncbi:hypothetical protein ABW19_dt0209682 [Dactylella cylindrospora]|nr:hypothetical protein ABW19_dt0209682 [Dactylella cylindrospora]
MTNFKLVIFSFLVILQLANTRYPNLQALGDNQVLPGWEAIAGTTYAGGGGGLDLDLDLNLVFELTIIEGNPIVGTMDLTAARYLYSRVNSRLGAYPSSSVVIAPGGNRLA